MLKINYNATFMTAQNLSDSKLIDHQIINEFMSKRIGNY